MANQGSFNRTGKRKITGIFDNEEEKDTAQFFCFISAMSVCHRLGKSCFASEFGQDFPLFCAIYVVCFFVCLFFRVFSLPCFRLVSVLCSFPSMPWLFLAALVFCFFSFPFPVLHSSSLAATFYYKMCTGPFQSSNDFLPNRGEEHWDSDVREDGRARDRDEPRGKQAYYPCSCLLFSLLF